MRAWSKYLGFSNNAPLSLMLSGKRPIPKKYIPAFAKSFKLSKKETNYLETLINYESQKDPTAKRFYLEKLKNISPNNSISSVEVETFKYFGNPICMTILEMSDLQDFQLDEKWILKRLNFKSTQSEIKDCIEVLKNLNLYTTDENGEFKKTYQHITNKTDIADKGSQNYHKNVSLLASEAILKEAINDREFNGYAFNIQKSKIPKAKELIRDFVKNFITEIEAQPNEGDETYQFNVQLFQLTKNKDKK